MTGCLSKQYPSPLNRVCIVLGYATWKNCYNINFSVVRQLRQEFLSWISLKVFKILHATLKFLLWATNQTLSSCALTTLTVLTSIWFLIYRTKHNVSFQPSSGLCVTLSPDYPLSDLWAALWHKRIITPRGSRWYRHKLRIPLSSHRAFVMENFVVCYSAGIWLLLSGTDRTRSGWCFLDASLCGPVFFFLFFF